ncbi:hypothetical protein PAESOLCIP111_02498 [Paenibacillus solanacearum]|uniref:Endonuclease/exonuclease/phosphatase domain-containing protein n=1 Tax=Paenibacillus solanacearum TaxID=2048548 RepID=A0A916K0V1_9BACL|nr:endonuclease/exonuclease/phosphatase family protein [Paenibacillus solanacearum]CAG7623234.1 hypothetical protein PAESOLCIP111_02498 [Paenibacillus solanacearum]
MESKAAQTEGGEPVRLKLMTFNIRNVKGDAGTINSWDNRKDIAVKAIDGFAPDLIGMQEAYEVQIQYFLSHLAGRYASIGESRMGNTDNEYCNIMYRSDRFDVLESGQFWLSETPDAAGSRSTLDADYPRICTWARFRTTSDERAEFYYFNTHYALKQAAQEQASRLILERVSRIVCSPEVPVFIGGDLNTEETGNAYSILSQSEFRDTWVEAGKSFVNDGTFGRFEGKTTGGHIDWIFHKNAGKIHSVEINYYNENGRYPSDHYPVQLDVEIPLTGEGTA